MPFCFVGERTNGVPLLCALYFFVLIYCDFCTSDQSDRIFTEAVFDCLLVHRHPCAPAALKTGLKLFGTDEYFKNKRLFGSAGLLSSLFNQKYWELVLLAAAIGAFRDVTHSGSRPGSCQSFVLKT